MDIFGPGKIKRRPQPERQGHRRARFSPDERMEDRGWGWGTVSGVSLLLPPPPHDRKDFSLGTWTEQRRPGPLLRQPQRTRPRKPRGFEPRYRLPSQGDTQPLESPKGQGTSRTFKHFSLGHCQGVKEIKNRTREEGQLPDVRDLMRNKKAGPFVQKVEKVSLEALTCKAFFPPRLSLDFS